MFVGLPYAVALSTCTHTPSSTDRAKVRTKIYRTKSPFARPHESCRKVFNSVPQHKQSYFQLEQSCKKRLNLASKADVKLIKNYTVKLAQHTRLQVT